MKKISLTLLPVIFAFTSSYASNFDGYYGSLALGWMQGDFNVNGSYIEQVVSTTIARGKSSFSDSLTKSPAFGGVALGVENSIKQNYLFGLETRANFESLNTSSNETITSTTTRPGDTTISKEAITIQLTAKRDFNLLIRLGVLLDPNVLIYTIIGPSYGYFEEWATVSNTNNDGFKLNFNMSESNYKLGWMGGIGLDYLVSKNISLALEYTHADYGKLDTLDGMASKTILTTTYQAFLDADIYAKSNNVSLRASYHFG